MRGIRAGRLRDRVTIQKPTETQDSFGGIQLTYTNFKTRRCDITPQRSAEGWLAGGERQEVRYEIRFRYEPGLLKEEYRLLDTRVSPNRIFDIIGLVNAKNENREYIVTVIERR